MIVRRAVHLFAIARYKRNGVTLIEKVDDVRAVLLFERKLFGKLFFDIHIFLTVCPSQIRQNNSAQFASGPLETVYSFYNTNAKNAIV